MAGNQQPAEEIHKVKSWINGFLSLRSLGLSMRHIETFWLPYLEALWTLHFFLWSHRHDWLSHWPWVIDLEDLMGDAAHWLWLTWRCQTCSTISNIIRNGKVALWHRECVFPSKKERINTITLKYLSLSQVWEPVEAKEENNMPRSCWTVKSVIT